MKKILLIILVILVLVLIIALFRQEPAEEIEVEEPQTEVDLPTGVVVEEEILSPWNLEEEVEEEIEE